MESSATRGSVESIASQTESAVATRFVKMEGAEKSADPTVTAPTSSVVSPATVNQSTDASPMQSVMKTRFANRVTEAMTVAEIHARLFYVVGMPSAFQTSTVPSANAWKDLLGIHWTRDRAASRLTASSMRTVQPVGCAVTINVLTHA